MNSDENIIIRESTREIKVTSRCMNSDENIYCKPRKYASDKVNSRCENSDENIVLYAAKVCERQK